jgi:hypothetical protein
MRSLSMSAQVTSCPIDAKQAAVVRPTTPAPMTAMLLTGVATPSVRGASTLLRPGEA